MYKRLRGLLCVCGYVRSIGLAHVPRRMSNSILACLSGPAEYYHIGFEAIGLCSRSPGAKILDMVALLIIMKPTPLAKKITENYDILQTKMKCKIQTKVNCTVIHDRVSNN